MKLGSIFKNTSWKWPPQLKMTSLQSKSILRHVKYSIFTDTAKFVAMLDSSWSQTTLYLPTTATTTTITTTMSGHNDDCEAEGSVIIEMEAIEEALRSKRMSFDPGNASSSILIADDDEEYNDKYDDDVDEEFCYHEVNTKDPYGDFRVSMEEMVEAKGLGADWEYLEELLGCYLKMNDKRNHGIIVGAFIDMFFGFLACSCSCSCSCSKHDVSCCDVYGSTSKDVGNVSVL